MAKVSCCQGGAGGYADRVEIQCERFHVAAPVCKGVAMILIQAMLHVPSETRIATNSFISAGSTWEQSTDRTWDCCWVGRNFHNGNAGASAC